MTVKFVCFAQNTVMTKQEAAQKRDLAKLLFIHETLTQKEVAARVSVSEVTISKWAKADAWESLKVSITITKEEQLKNLYRQLSAINEEIASRPDRRFATTAEADTISKLASSIDKMETAIGVSDIISVGKKFLDWVRKFDLRKAQEITPLYDAFIKDNLR
jgi:transcriptional regulator with XRE-family HTH domain